MNGVEIAKRRKELNMTQLELAQKLGVSRRTVLNYESGGIIPESKSELLRSILFSDEAKFDNDVRPLPSVEFMNVPLVPVSAQAGYPRGYGDREYVESLPTIPVFVDRNYRGKYMVFEVSGDSMDDGTRQSLCDGDKILCREVKRELWQSKLHIRDWFFVIVCIRDGITVKQVTEHDVERGVIRCHPLNPLFEDFDLNLDEDVAEIYNVIKIVDRSTRI